MNTNEILFFAKLTKLEHNTAFRYDWSLNTKWLSDASSSLPASLWETAVLHVWCLFLRVAFHQGWTQSEGPATMGWSRGSTGTATASTLPIADPSTSTDGRYPSEPESLTVGDFKGQSVMWKWVLWLPGGWSLLLLFCLMAVCVCGVVSSVTTLTSVGSCFVASGTELVIMLIWNVTQRQCTLLMPNGHWQ